MTPHNNANGYASAMRRYAMVSGRSSRSEFWYFTLVSGALSLGTTLMDNGLRTGGILHLLVLVVHAIPSLTVFVRRMHDTGRTGWWFLAVFTVIGIIPVFAFLCQRGTPAVNRFGAALGPNGRPVPVEAAAIVTTAQVHGRDPIAEVERLAELRAKGAISDAEFERMKAAVFATPSTGVPA